MRSRIWLVRTSERPLLEKEAERIRRPKARDLEDPFVHHEDRDARWPVGAEVNLERLAGLTRSAPSA